MAAVLEVAGTGAADLTWERGCLPLSRRVHVAGILNVTPDSFSDGGSYPSPADAVAAALRMFDEGADLVDVGGESTRPGACPVGIDEEIARVVPVIEALRAHGGVPVSIDTRHAPVARAALEAGADIVNDVSALRADPEMGAVCARAGAPVILMHMKGEPRTMQAAPHYNDVVAEVYAFFVDALARAAAAGIDPGRTVLDPGIGFGKRVEDNLALVDRLDAFAPLGRPLMLGASRKSFIGRVLGGAPDAPPLDVRERLEGTLAVSALAVLRGARLVRVHDVRANVRAIRMTEAIVASRSR